MYSKTVPLTGGVLVGLLLSCADTTSPTTEVDGILAYSEPGIIHLLDLSDGSDKVLHSFGPGTDIRNLTWAPDGGSLVFHVFAFGQHTRFLREWKMYRISADGTDLSLMFDREGPEKYPSYGGDGRLAYWGTHGLYIDTWLVYPANTDDVQSAPTWSPDGRNIAFVSGYQVVQIALEDTSDVFTIVDNNQYFGTVREPAYSPEGSHLAFVREISPTESEIWITNIDGSNEVALTSGHLDRHPSWSKDGSVLAFVRNQNSVYTIEAHEDGREQMLVRNPVEHIAWSW